MVKNALEYANTVASHRCIRTLSEEVNGVGVGNIGKM